jgi:beta-galactosidase
VNPAQQLDFARFSDAALRACFVAERDAVRAYSSAPVTTNFMAASCPSTDLFAWGKEVDLVSNDHYLRAADPRGYVGLALAADLTRSVAGGKPWLLLEHSTSAVNWQPRNVAKRPGELARNSFAHLGRGADAIMFFQWRASRSGAEKFHSAMLPHAGTGSRVWREVTELGANLGRLTELRGSRVTADVALLWDYESFWAQDLEFRPSEGARHRERVDTYYDRLWRDGHTVDLARPSQDLSGYKLVVAPASYLLTAEAAANLTAYVAAGGTLLVSYFSGIVDEHDAVHPGGFMAPLRDALGVQVEEFLPLRDGEVLTVTYRAGTAGAGAATTDATELTGTVWADDLVLHGAEPVGSYVDGPKPGGAAITRHRHGAGTGDEPGRRCPGHGHDRRVRERRAGAVGHGGGAGGGAPDRRGRHLHGGDQPHRRRGEAAPRRTRDRSAHRRRLRGLGRRPRGRGPCAAYHHPLTAGDNSSHD